MAKKAPAKKATAKKATAKKTTAKKATAKNAVAKKAPAKKAAAGKTTAKSSAVKKVAAKKTTTKKTAAKKVATKKDAAKALEKSTEALVDPAKQANKHQSDLQKLVLKGKSQGFLTYAEINDHLPENMHDTDQIEVVVNMINDMGIEVVDKAPDTDNIELKRDNPEDEEVAEEVGAVLKTAVESEFGRTTDPVRMYMREMGTVELLTREDEIALAKRIEAGNRQVSGAVSLSPRALRMLIDFADKIEAGEMKLTDMVVDFMELNALDDETVATPGEPGQNAVEAEESPSGPDPEDAAERFKRMRKIWKLLEKRLGERWYR